MAARYWFINNGGMKKGFCPAAKAFCLSVVLTVTSVPNHSAQRFDASIQLALVTSGLVAVNDAFVDHGINHGHGGLQALRGFVFFASGHGVQYVLDDSAHLGTGSHVVGTTLNGLTGALDCRFNISHGIRNSKQGRLEK